MPKLLTAGPLRLEKLSVEGEKPAEKTAKQEMWELLGGRNCREPAPRPRLWYWAGMNDAVRLERQGRYPDCHTPMFMEVQGR
jgi:hypothetical protein